MNNKALAVKIVKFMYDYDVYSFWDSFSDKEEAIDEVKYGLKSDAYCKGMCNELLDISNNDEDFSMRIRAAKLYREIIKYRKDIK